MACTTDSHQWLRGLEFAVRVATPRSRSAIVDSRYSLEYCSFFLNMCAHSERTAQNLSGAAVWSAFLAFVVNYTKPYVSSLYTIERETRNASCKLCASSPLAVVLSTCFVPFKAYQPLLQSHAYTQHGRAKTYFTAPSVPTHPTETPGAKGPKRKGGSCENRWFKWLVYNGAHLREPRHQRPLEARHRLLSAGVNFAPALPERH